VTLWRILIEKGTVSSQICDMKYLPLWHEQRVLSCRVSLVGLIKISMAMLIMEEMDIIGTTPLVDFHSFFSCCSHAHFLGFFPLCCISCFLSLCFSFIYLPNVPSHSFFFFPFLAFSALLFGLQDLCCHTRWKCLNALQHRLLYILGLQDRGQFNVSASSRYKATGV